MTPNRVILMYRQDAKTDPLTPDLLSVTCVGEGSARQQRTERKREKTEKGAVQCHAHYDPLKTWTALWRGAIHHQGLSNQHVCHCN